MLSSPNQVGGVVAAVAALGIVGVAEEADEVVDVEPSAMAHTLEAEEGVVATNATTEATTLAGQNNAPASTVARDAQSACPLR